MKEAGIALIFGSLSLLLFFYVGHKVSLSPPATPEPVVATERKNPYEALALEAEAAIVYDLAEERALYEKNADAQLPLASLTKLLTIYAASRTLTPTSPILITASALNAEGDSGLIEGDTLTFNDAAALALVASSNDAAAAIEEAIQARAPRTDKNPLLAAALQAGLSQTYALNGTGLDETEEISGAYGSARDIAILSGALLSSSPLIASLSTKASVTVASLDGNTYAVENTNDVLQRLPNVLLSKTGFTDLAGGNLVVVFDAGINHPIALVVLGSSRDARFTDVERLLSRTLVGFSTHAL
jgi:D-alanyl-D-alanine carboxypeptidase (penicillin-binding protein 5/6)